MPENETTPEPEAPEAGEEAQESEPKAEGKKKRKRRRWPIVLLVIFAVLFLLAFGFYEYSNTSQFCNSCHIMNPYYKAWETSSHNFVPCVGCHVSPEDGAKWDAKIQGILQVMKYVTRTYSSKPYAEIEDSSCLRSDCHDQRLLEEHSTEQFKNNVVFDHGPHLAEVRRGKRLRCTSCHAQIVVGTHMEVTTSTCYLCHFKESDAHDVEELSSCRQCHRNLPDQTIEHRVTDPSNPNMVIDVVSFNHTDFIGDRDIQCQSCHFNAVIGSGPAEQDRCFDCHNVPEHLERIGDIDFIHDNHITEHNVTCERCHEAIRHEVRTATLGMVQTCSRCHVATHGGQRDMYMGRSGRGADESMPNIMFERMVDCSGCHMGSGEASQSEHPFNGYTRYATTKEGCADCHGEDTADYEEAYEEYIAEVKERLPSLKTELSRAQARFRSLSRQQQDDLRSLLEVASYNIDFVEKSKGWAHNWEYSGLLLDIAEEKLEILLR